MQRRPIVIDFPTGPHSSSKKPFSTPVRRVASALLAAGLTAGILVHDAQATDGKEKEVPFKVAKIYFETNGSKCDMGIQIVFDTEGIVTGKFKDPNDRIIHVVRARTGLLDIGGQTEGFLESVEPVILDLAEATDGTCEADPEDLPDAITLDDMRHYFPAGRYEFEGITADGEEYDDEAELTYDVPDGPVLKSPDGEVGINPDRPVKIRWKPVTMTIPGLLPNGAQAPVDIVAYQVLVFDANAGESPPEFNVVVPATETSVAVPRQFLQPNTDYNIEVLAIEKSGNQTITEGEFSTGPSQP
jgi:hypothetical protein